MTLYRQARRDAALADIRAALSEAGGNVSTAAKLLELSVRSLHRYIDTLELRPFLAECRYHASLARQRQQCHTRAQVAQATDTIPVPAASVVSELPSYDFDVIGEPLRRE